MAEDTRPRRSKVAVTVLVVCIALAGILPLVYLYSNGSLPLLASLSSSSQSMQLNTGGKNTAASTTDSFGLKLILIINTTQVLTNESVSLSAILYNTLSRPVNLTGERPGQGTETPIGNNGSWDFPFMGFPLAPAPQCFWNGPFEFVVLRGNYSTSSLIGLGGKGLALPIMCMWGGMASSYLIQPHSDEATLSIPSCASCSDSNKASSGPWLSNATVVMSGYWNVPTSQSGPPFSMPAPHSWTPGVYTIAVGDSWGDVVALHLIVEGASVTSSPYVCFVSGPGRDCKR
jgi:hypothetical protein